MPYTTLDEVKRRLQITTNDKDALLSKLIEEVDAEINMILAPFIKVPIQDAQLRLLLDGIEADWVCGRYRFLMEPGIAGPEHPLTAQSRKRLEGLIEFLKNVVERV